MLTEFPFRYQVPVRIMLGRNEDMITSGGRHPFLAKYKVGGVSCCVVLVSTFGASDWVHLCREIDLS